MTMAGKLERRLKTLVRPVAHLPDATAFGIIGATNTALKKIGRAHAAEYRDRAFRADSYADLIRITKEYVTLDPDIEEALT